MAATSPTLFAHGRRMQTTLRSIVLDHRHNFIFVGAHERVADIQAILDEHAIQYQIDRYTDRTVKQLNLINSPASCVAEVFESVGWYVVSLNGANNTVLEGSSS